MKDALQKEALFRHFTMRGYFVQTEVPVYQKEGVDEDRKFITDVDVFALRPSPDLSWEVVLGDCKTLKGVSPANRALWLRGLMEHFRASNGIVILRLKKDIEKDHKLFANDAGITLLDEVSFTQYDKAINYPQGSLRFGYSTESLNDLRFLYKRFVRLAGFCEFLYGHSWNECNRINLIRRTLGEARVVSREIDPRHYEHLALILDAAAIFSVGLAECVGKTFSQYLHPDTKSQLDEALKLIIWGGRSQYIFMSRLRENLVASRGGDTSQVEELNLPSWGHFLHLVRSLLDAPLLAFKLPQLFRRAALDFYVGADFLIGTDRQHLTLLKYGMLTIKYFCQASGFPPEVTRILEDEFISAQARVVEGRSSGTGSTPESQEESTSELGAGTRSKDASAKVAEKGDPQATDLSPSSGNPWVAEESQIEDDRPQSTSGEGPSGSSQPSSSSTHHKAVNPNQTQLSLGNRTTDDAE